MAVPGGEEDGFFRPVDEADASGASAGDGGLFVFFSSSNPSNISLSFATGEEALRSVLSVAEDEAGEFLLLDLDLLRDQKSDRTFRALVKDKKKQHSKQNKKQVIYTVATALRALVRRKKRNTKQNNSKTGDRCCTTRSNKASAQR